MSSILPACFRNFHKLPKYHIQTTWATMSTGSEVILETAGNKGIITLNRPKALNAGNLDMLNKIHLQLKAWNSDPDIKLVIVKSSSDKAFSAGGDLPVLTRALKCRNMILAEEFFAAVYRLNYLISCVKIPYISLINGIIMGGGLGLAIHGSHRICTERTVCAVPEVAVGYFPDAGATYCLPRLPGKLGLFLGLTGYKLHGRDVFEAGIATHLVDSRSPGVDDDKDSGLKPLMSKVNTVFEATSIENIMENLQKEGSDWSHKIYSILKKSSPTSLKVIFEQLKRGANMTLEDCLKTEYTLCQRFMADHDFPEGVRAVLIEKDNKPNWKPSTLEEISEDKVMSYFQPLPSDKVLEL